MKSLVSHYGTGSWSFSACFSPAYNVMPGPGGSRVHSLRIGDEQREHGFISFGTLGLSISLSRKIWNMSFNVCCNRFKGSCDCTPAVEYKLTLLSYFGSPFSSWLPLPDCSHHGSRVQRSPSEGQRADGIWGSPSGTSNSHSRLSRVSIRLQNKQLDRKEYRGPLTPSGTLPCHVVEIL